MWEKIHDFLKREVLHKTRDMAIDPVGPAIGGGVLVLSFTSWALIGLATAGIVFAIIMIVKISKKKKEAQA